MNLKYIFPLAVLLFLIIFIYSFLKTSINPEEYIQNIEAERAEIVNFMENDPESPFNKKR